METKINEPRAMKLLEIIKPDLLRILDNAPSYGSSGLDIIFHNNEIVRIALRAEYSKLKSPNNNDPQN